MIARTIFAHGKVQGVCFRDWTVRQARELGLSGWVRNRRDGRVEIYVAGEADLVNRLIDQVGKGSPGSRVDQILVEEAQVEELGGFGRRSTT